MRKSKHSLPLILALESSGDSGGAALLRGDSVVAEHAITDARAHGRQLVPCIDAVFEKARAARSDLSLVLVNQGPGSYTGLRIGQAAAETIALVLGIPVLGVPALEVMCEEALQLGLIPDDATTLLPALDARRGEFVCARFEKRDEMLARDCDDEVIPPAKLCEFAPDGGVLFGDAARIYAAEIPSGFTLISDEIALRASSVGLAAWRMWSEQLNDPASIAIARVELSYFRPVLAQTVAERQAIAEAKAAARRKTK